MIGSTMVEKRLLMGSEERIAGRTIVLSRPFPCAEVKGTFGETGERYLVGTSGERDQNSRAKMKLDATEPTKLRYMRTIAELSKQGNMPSPFTSREKPLRCGFDHLLIKEPNEVRGRAGDSPLPAFPRTLS